MPEISLIVAMDTQHGIGYQNQLLCHLPADLKHFKAVTMGKPIIMGHHTYKSIGKPLPGRLNIVLTRQKIQIEGVQIAHDLSEALAIAAPAEEVMIIGGAQIFIQSMALATRIYITEVHNHFQADVFFPELDPKEWQRHVLSTYSRDEKNLYDMTFYVLKRIKSG